MIWSQPGGSGSWCETSGSSQSTSRNYNLSQIHFYSVSVSLSWETLGCAISLWCHTAVAVFRECICLPFFITSRRIHTSDAYLKIEKSPSSAKYLLLDWMICKGHMRILIDFLRGNNFCRSTKGHKSQNQDPKKQGRCFSQLHGMNERICLSQLTTSRIPAYTTYTTYFQWNQYIFSSRYLYNVDRLNSCILVVTWYWIESYQCAA